ncbi:hypothetical protein [Arhodomonas sp. AD133]|uniref:hypothetical protein n=1 Tax=Arhodomonas sp. AD133 TaxID=3415009 RepID=UPI003EB7C765
MPRNSTATPAASSVICHRPDCHCPLLSPARVAEHLRLHREAATLLRARPALTVEDLRAAVDRAPHCHCPAPAVEPPLPDAA